MKVVILCGGLGTRLREETEFRPKPMVEVGGKPLLWHIMRHYSRHGFDDFVLCLGYKGELIRHYFMDFRAMNSDVRVDLATHSVEYVGELPEGHGWSVTLAETGATAQTSDRLLAVRRHIDGETFLCTYGDGLSNVDLTRLVAFHRERGKLMTVTGVRPPSRFGELEVKDGIASRFREKPVNAGALVSGGFFAMERRFLERLRPGEMFERETMQQLAEEGQLAVYEHAGYWASMDTYRDVMALNAEWDTGKPGWTRPA